jgi:16S rRNA (guanine1207-N2)-methyltransferase
VTGDHYFAAQPTAPSRPRRVHLALADLDHELGFTTDAGVFAAGEVDPGSRLLLVDGARPDPAARVLADVGCGYGPIAVVLALRAPEAEVWAVDVNERAVALCRDNAERAGVADRVHAVTPDAVPPDLVLDGLWSNPPIRTGKAVLHGLMDEWLPRLAPGGEAHLVVAKNLGADSLATWLIGRGHTVARRASRRGYRLLDVTPGI